MDNINNEETAKAIQNESILWKSSKNQTKIDQDATYALLSLKKRFEQEFDDKKCTKNIIWGKIVEEMNEMGFFVGHGIPAREKLRQKFANLQSTYMKTIDRRNKTGEGRVSNPPFFEELHDILGDKHKTKPVMIIDSLKCTKTKEVEDTSNSIDENVDVNNVEYFDKEEPSTSGIFQAQEKIIDLET